MATATIESRKPSGSRTERLTKYSNGREMTAAEFDAIHRYDRRYLFELIKGVVVVSPLPLQSETDPVEELGTLLRIYQRTHPQGHSLDKTLPQQYVGNLDSRRIADHVIWAGLGRVPDPVKDVPTIVVEFVSRRKRDRDRDYRTKRQEYIDVGVKEYWIMDRFRRQMTAVRQTADRPMEIVIAANEIYTTPLLPGFELRPEAVFAVADDWRG